MQIQPVDDTHVCYVQFLFVWSTDAWSHMIIVFVAPTLTVEHRACLVPSQSAPGAVVETLVSNYSAAALAFAAPASPSTPATPVASLKNSSHVTVAWGLTQSNGGCTYSAVTMYVLLLLLFSTCA